MLYHILLTNAVVFIWKVILWTASNIIIYIQQQYCIRKNTSMTFCFLGTNEFLLCMYCITNVWIDCTWLSLFNYCYYNCLFLVSIKSERSDAVGWNMEDGWCAGWVSLYPSRCAPRIQVHVPDWSKRRRLRCPPPWLGRNTEHRGLLGPWCTPSSCPHNLGGNKGSYYFISL